MLERVLSMSKCMTRWRPPADEPPGDLVPLLKEMLAGADDRAPSRPGRFLETPQKFGLLPTLHFWNRRDIARSARWFTAPVTVASMIATAVVVSTMTIAHPWLLPLVGVICGAPVVLAHGLLERHVRRRLRSARPPPLGPSGDGGDGGQ